MGRMGRFCPLQQYGGNAISPAYNSCCQQNTGSNNQHMALMYSPAAILCTHPSMAEHFFYSLFGKMQSKLFEFDII